MKTKLKFSQLFLLSAFCFPLSLSAQGTAFTYQGRLNDGATVATGIYDLRFAIFDAASGGFQVPWVTNSATAVSNGLFTVTLDFGNVFSGAGRWLEIAVRTNGGGAFTVLDPRQALTPTPYAIFAGGASNLVGAVSSANLAGTYAQAVTLNNPGNVFTGNGTGVTNVNAVTLNGFGSGSFWQLGGNNVAAGQFLGSTNNQPVEIKVNGLRALRLEPTVNDVNHSNIVNVVGGSAGNYVANGIYGATIAGGGGVFFGLPITNIVSADFGTVGGGAGNVIRTNAYDSTIGGGYLNQIQPNAYGSTIGGGSGNQIQTNAIISTIGGGYNNQIQTNAYYSTIGGGADNVIQTNANNSTIGGGNNNRIQPNATYATIPGGYGNSATNDGIAAGRRAKAIHPGAFVWGDSTDASFASTAANQFLIRAGGGVGINTSNPVVPLTIEGSGAYNSIGAAAIVVRNPTANKSWEWHVLDDGKMQFADLDAGATRMLIDTAGNVSANSFITTSDRHAKENFSPVNAQDVLAKVAALPISQWNFKSETAVQHVGPMAQDFRAAFGLGTDERHIATVDADGVALAAIQGLNEKVEQKLAQKQTEITELQRQLNELKVLVQQLAEGKQK